jgi:hypothetical protein
MAKNRARTETDWLGALVGLGTFLGGVGLLAVTFQLAYSLFSVPPESALGQPGQRTIDLAKAGDSFAGLVARILLLFVMSVVGSVVANRGIKLYVSSRHVPPRDAESPELPEREQGIGRDVPSAAHK